MTIFPMQLPATLARREPPRSHLSVFVRYQRLWIAHAGCRPGMNAQNWKATTDHNQPHPTRLMALEQAFALPL
jgi:hypothetical protein